MLLVDVDALCKLAHWNILPLLPELTGYVWGKIATVSSLKHRAHRSMTQPDMKLFHCTAAAATACDFIDQMGQVPAPDEELLAALGESQQIDAGEAVLLASVANDPDGCFLTGDKRALRSLAGLDCARRFAGKIFVIEQVVGCTLMLKKRDWLLENMCPYRHIDKAVGAILGSRCDAGIESIEEGARSYANEIVQLRTPSLLRKSDFL